MANYASIGLICLFACYTLCERRLLDDNSQISVKNDLKKVPYGTRSLLTWKRDGTYYFTPLGNFQRSSIRYLTSSDGARTLLFSIILTDDAMRRSLVNYLRRYTGECVTDEQIKMVPINKLKITLLAGPGSGYLINKHWTVYLVFHPNPGEINLKLDCQITLICDLFKSILENNPKMEMSFNVTGNNFKLPIIALNGSDSDVTKYEYVPCKAPSQVKLQSIRENVEEMAEALKQVVSSEAEAVRTLHQITQLLNNTKKRGNKNCLFEDSMILKPQPDVLVTLHNLLKDVISDKCWKKCYRGEDNNFDAGTFHRNCDLKGPTITILKVGPHIVGGYTDKSWDTSGTRRIYVTSHNSILFSLTNATRMTSTRRPINAIFVDQDYGPTFGGGYDLHISNNCGTKMESFTNLGYSYQLPSGYRYLTTQAKKFLVGSYKFLCSDYEVYYATTKTEMT